MAFWEVAMLLAKGRLDIRATPQGARTLLSQVPDVLPQAAVEHYGSELAWLADETGDARDLDVLTLSAEAWEAPLPDDVRAALAPFWELIRQRARASHERLNAALASQRYARLVATWRELLERGSAGLERLPDARRTVADVAAERIARRYRKLRKKARRLRDANDPDAALHEVRIDAKKLRYLLEIFRTAFADEDVDALVKPLKKLQSSLGDANDATVHLAIVRSAAEELAARAPAPVETLLALGRVGATLEERRTSARARGERALAHLLTKSVRRDVQKSFGS
jgi:CHAD domain-containing protein